MNSIEITKYIESKFPKEAAYDWDNVGLQVGSLNHKVLKVLIALDVTKEVVKEAIEHKVDLIISHHPLIFKPIMNLQSETPRGWIITNLIKHSISLYSMHTNYDVSDGGMNDAFSKKLGLTNLQVLDESENIGRIGEIKEISFDDFVKLLKSTFSFTDIKLIGDHKTSIKKVALSLGSGSHHMSFAKRKNCDVFLTGDVTYHTALDAIQMGLTILDIGHYAEVIFKDSIFDDLSEKFLDIEFIKSNVNTNPYKVL